MAPQAIEEGLRLRLMLGITDLGREDALAIALALGTPGTFFPRHFSPEGEVRGTG
jgi:hypothetical protein